MTARYGWLCAECYDKLADAWKYVLKYQHESEFRDGNRVV